MKKTPVQLIDEAIEEQVNKHQVAKDHNMQISEGLHLYAVAVLKKLKKAMA